jgi:putative ABC transport system permease protein
MKYVLKTIMRNFIRKPVNNLINLIGLTISMTLVIILSIYCYSELTTDSFHKDGDRVYLFSLAEGEIYTPGILKEHVDQKVPDVESTVRISGTWDVPVFQVDENDPVNSDLVYADEDFFKLFTYKFIEGNPGTALKEPMTIVITKTLSDKLFGEEEATGRVIKLNNNKSLTVCAVVEEPDANSCLSFSALTSIATRKIIQYEPGEFLEWGWRDFQTFLLLKNGVDETEAGRKIFSLFPDADHKGSENAALTPLRKVYFSDFTLYGSNYLKSGDKRKVRILVLVAGMVLMIALINFINISASQWQEKIKQTGILKIAGAQRSEILRNVLIESFLFFLLALIIALGIVDSFTPFISNYTGIHYGQKIIYSPGFIIASLSTILLLSVVFSIIPALRISSSRAVDNLKKSTKSNKTNFSFRSVFVIVQFLIAIVLIAFTVLIRKQVRFGSDDLGFNENNIIGIKITEQLGQKKEVLKSMLLEIPEIRQVTFTQYFPGNVISQWGAPLESDEETKMLNFYTFSADASVFEMLGLQLINGRFYSDSLSEDKGKMVVNETFLREHNLTEPLGSKIKMNGQSREIIGVVKDFHFQPLTQPVSSLAIRNDSYASVCLVNIQQGDFKFVDGTFNKIRNIVSELSPSFPVDVSFFDQAIQNMYQSELRFRHIFFLLAGCALVICSLGILAMSLFACQCRVKEIGIRKVSGAEIPEILMMLNKNFVKWVLIAFSISTPLAWFIMKKWLENFAYKTELSWWIFAEAGIIALAVALLTVSWQSWRVATRNPVEALRYE